MNLTIYIHILCIKNYLYKRLEKILLQEIGKNPNPIKSEDRAKE